MRAVHVRLIVVRFTVIIGTFWLDAWILPSQAPEVMRRMGLTVSDVDCIAAAFLACI